MTEILSVAIAAIALAQTAALTTSIYLHRALAHRALAVHPAAQVFFRTALWLTTGQSRQQWVAVHRKHHAFTDRHGDPHSPRLHGLWHVLLLNAYYYSREARNPETVKKYAADIPEDRLDGVFAFGSCGLGLGTSLLCLLLGLWPGLAAAGAHAVLYVFVLTPLINGLGHWRGAQNFTNNTAHNWRGVAWATAGESLHNNHHAHPRAPKFSMRRFEFDPSWLLIRTLARVRLVAILGAPVEMNRNGAPVSHE